MLKWLIPSAWIKWLQGRKRILGAIQLVLWVLIYALPALHPDWQAFAVVGQKIQEFLVSLGLDIGGELLGSGVGFTVVGLLDWLFGHRLSLLLEKLFSFFEGLVKKLGYSS